MKETYTRKEVEALLERHEEKLFKEFEIRPRRTTPPWWAFPLIFVLMIGAVAVLSKFI